MPNVRRFVLLGAVVSGLASPCAALAGDEPPAAAAPASTASASAPPSVPPASPAPASPAVSAKPKVTALQGAIVIALGDDAAPAARALARDVYGTEELRPRIDDATARVLAGSPPPDPAPPKLTEIAEIRRAAQASGSDSVARPLLASLGADLGAELVVAVTMRSDKPIARVLSVAAGTFAPVEFPSTAEPQPDGSTRTTWPNVPGLFVTLLTAKPAPSAAASSPAPKGSAPAPSGSAKPPGPLAPKKDEPARSFWTSPWTWAGVGVVVAAGVIVFAVSQAQDDGGGLRLQGRVSP